ncbi:hypothetical protein B0H34DRAFT_679585 [Crassisporium funariophilum]|nr:hypothetical protein B0H34DRAFT_679585 [Crassisporium funariophilum]
MVLFRGPSGRERIRVAEPPENHCRIRDLTRLRFTRIATADPNHSHGVKIEFKSFDASHNPPATRNLACTTPKIRESPDSIQGVATKICRQCQCSSIHTSKTSKPSRKQGSKVGGIVSSQVASSFSEADFARHSSDKVPTARGFMRMELKVQLAVILWEIWGIANSPADKIDGTFAIVSRPGPPSRSGCDCLFTPSVLAICPRPPTKTPRVQRSTNYPRSITYCIDLEFGSREAKLHATCIIPSIPPKNITSMASPLSKIARKVLGTKSLALPVAVPYFVTIFFTKTL